MTLHWYYARPGEEPRGPVSSSELTNLVETRQLAPTDLAWREGLAEWVAVASLRLNHRPPAVPPARPDVPPASAVPSAMATAPDDLREPPLAGATWQAGLGEPSPPPAQSPPPVQSPGFVVDTDRSKSTRATTGSRRKSNQAAVWVACGAIGIALLATGVAIGLLLRKPDRDVAQSASAGSESDTRHTPATLAGVGRSSTVPGELPEDSPLEFEWIDEPRQPRGSTHVGPPASGPGTTNASPDAATSGDPRGEFVARGSGTAGDAPLPSSSPPGGLTDNFPKTRAATSEAGPDGLEGHIAPSDPNVGNVADAAAMPERGVQARPAKTASATVTEQASNPDEVNASTKADRRLTLYQDVEIRRKPNFSVQGMAIPQHVHYRILSRFDIQPRKEDGTRDVLQYVEETRLLQADELSRGTFRRSLEGLKHKQYTFKLNPRGEVIDFRGHTRNVAALPAQLLNAKGFQLTSVIDKDGWEELAELSCFQPDEPPGSAAAMKRPMNHDWEPLGSWYGTTTIVANGEVPSQGSRAERLRQFRYTHEMSYVPPEQNRGGLPFRITNANFKTNVATGTILYDPAKRRVREVQEQFDVSGTVTTQVLGQPSIIELREQQSLTIRLSERRPTWQ